MIEIVCKIIFAIFWIFVHIAIWFFAAIITLVRFPSIGEFSIEKLSDVFVQSVWSIKNGDPMLLLIAVIIALIRYDIGSIRARKPKS